MDLMAPLDPDAPPSEEELEAEGDLFMNSLAQFGGGK
jgi:hypothetical protein